MKNKGIEQAHKNKYCWHHSEKRFMCDMYAMHKKKIVKKGERKPLEKSDTKRLLEIKLTKCL